MSPEKRQKLQLLGSIMTAIDFALSVEAWTLTEAAKLENTKTKLENMSKKIDKDYD